MAVKPVARPFFSAVATSASAVPDLLHSSMNVLNQPGGGYYNQPVIVPTPQTILVQQTAAAQFSGFQTALSLVTSGEEEGGAEVGVRAGGAGR